MSTRVAYSFSALLLLVAATFGFLAVATPAEAVYSSAEYCVWYWQCTSQPNVSGCPGGGSIIWTQCGPNWTSSDCFGDCESETGVCLDDCTTNDCKRECIKVEQKCRRACRPAV